MAFVLPARSTPLAHLHWPPVWRDSSIFSPLSLLPAIQEDFGISSYYPCGKSFICRVFFTVAGAEEHLAFRQVEGFMTAAGPPPAQPRALRIVGTL